MPANRRTVGVLGGMGPAATIDLMTRVLQRSPREPEQAGVHLIVDSNPSVPDRNEAILLKGPSPGPLLASMAMRLEAAGADLVVLACNTAHAFQPAIERAISIPFLSMIEEASDVAARLAPGGVVGLLAGEGCLTADLYQEALARRGLDYVAPEGRFLGAFMQQIYAIKAGDAGPDASERMAGVATHLEDRGATLFIAACTEVPLVLRPGATRLPLIDATDVLATAIVDCALGRRELENRRRGANSPSLP